MGGHSQTPGRPSGPDQGPEGWDAPVDTSQRVDLSRYTGGPATRPPPQPPPSPDEPPTSAIGWVMGSPRRPPSQPPEPRGRTFRVVFILVVTTVVLVLLGLAAVYAANNWFPG